ncbi:putative hydro-lyase [Humitalea sp. 24SJ18S-53]|uniref:putative hydro-lyase n=1 Tax=Humitalea sp. 24SJ18S-53 TaxID=3422307 RepID=UPI003D6713A2
MESNDPFDLRAAFRAGWSPRSTARLAPGRVQANFVALPAASALDFAAFCQRNPRSCPVLAMGAPGERLLPGMGRDFDLATDLPRYRVWRDGAPAEEPTDIADLWRDDMVGFLLGCSYSFEWALGQAGMVLRHWASGSNPPIYRTNIPCVSAGNFAGNIIVSMRPLRPADAIRAVQITSRFPRVHGAPLHIGLPELIGVDLDRRDGGDDLSPQADELPVFWACGVTPESALRAAKLPFAITHYPGAMAITDLWNADLAE